jgi:putative transcriptional regulator
MITVGLYQQEGREKMKEKIIVFEQTEHCVRGKTDWNRVKNLTEAEILAAAKSDPDALPLTKRQIKQFKRVHPVATVDVKKVREKFKFSQAQFAAFFGISKRTLQQWEQHRSEPNAMARNFLRVIEVDPKLVQRALS